MSFEKRFEDPFVYSEYEYQLANNYIIPKLKRIGINPKGKKVLDAGCGWGGCSVAFKKAKAKCTAFDLSEHQISVAKKFSHEKISKIDFYKDDVCNLKTKGKFDIILFRDVIEYVDNPLKALISLKSVLADGGILYVEFAPWFGAYGGHQHHPDSIAKYFPYIHLIPKGIFLNILKNKKGLMFKDEYFLKEIKLILKNKISIRRFEKYIKMSHLKVYQKNFYLLRPAFKIRFGLPIIELGILKGIPLLKEFATSGVEYFIKNHPS